MAKERLLHNCMLLIELTTVIKLYVNKPQIKVTYDMCCCDCTCASLGEYFDIARAIEQLPSICLCVNNVYSI
jgi:hypothetical protein